MSGAGLLGRTMVVVVACVMFAPAASMGGEVVIVDPPQRPRKTDFADFLMTREVACQGVLIALTEERRVPAGPCPPMFTLELGCVADIAVTSVIAGTVDDSVLKVFIPALGRSRLPSLGEHVVCWGFRECSDGWRISGLIAWPDSTGRLISRGVVGMWLRNLGRDKPPTWSALQSRLRSSKGGAVYQAVRRSSGLGLVRIAKISRSDGRTIKIACEPLAPLLGSLPPPSFVTFRPGDACALGIAEGDSVVVPMTPHSHLSICPDQFRVRYGYVPWFGCPLDSLATRVAMASGHVAIVRGAQRVR